MSKIKQWMDNNEFLCPPSSPQQLWEEDMNGYQNMGLQQQKLFEQVGDGLNIDNNFSSPSMTKQEPSAVSKPEILVLNGRAKQNTGTLETKQKAKPYIPKKITEEVTKAFSRYLAGEITLTEYEEIAAPLLL